MIPEAKDLISFTPDHGCAGVVCRSAMLPSVNLDHELGTMTSKVEYEVPERHLFAKVMFVVPFA
jgi:hypothetical protein